MDDRRWLLALKACVSATLLARGWLTFRWDGPVRSLVWHEDWWAGPLETLAGISWDTFATRSDPWLSACLDGLGMFLMACAALPWVLRGRRGSALLWAPAVLLLLDAFGRWIDADRTVGMAIEHTAQVAAPLALWFALRHPARRSPWIVSALAATALTFAGHGLYAAGVHPVPLSYQTMTMEILGLDREAALRFLLAAGWLDWGAALLLLVPRARAIALGYMVAWGALTAAARTVAHAGVERPLLGLDPWIAETLVRTPHWALPLLAWMLIRARRTEIPGELQAAQPAR